MLKRICLIAVAVVAGSISTAFAASPATCSGTGSTMSCYPSEGSGSLAVLFPRSNVDFGKYYGYLAQNPAVDRLDFMLETTRRIDRVIANTKLTLPMLSALNKSKIKLNKQIAMEVQAHKNALPTGEVFDTTKTFQGLSIQQRPLSCEISATAAVITTMTQTGVTEDMLEASMVKQYYGLGVDRFGIWGNPDAGFVGNIYGSQRKMTGYGVYETPIAALYKKHGLTTALPQETVDISKRLTEVLTAVKSGKRVQLWGDWCTDPSAEDGLASEVTTREANTLGVNAKNVCGSWDKDRTLNWSYIGPNLEKIEVKAWNGEHAFILMGYYGTPEKPTHIIVWDVYTGRHVYPVSEWMRKWSKVENRALIISGQ